MKEYNSQLKVIVYDLGSSDPGIINNAYDALTELWMEFADDINFESRLRAIISDHPNLIVELKKRVDVSRYKGSEENILSIKANDFISSESKVDFENKKTEQITEKEDAKHKKVPLAQSNANLIAGLIGTATLIGGLSAGYDSAIGIVLSLLILTVAVTIFTYSIIIDKS